MLDGSRLVAVHETAHQWFYAMVGDSQALHPWLDEAFAQYAEQLVDGDPEPPRRCAAPGPVDASTESYGTDVQRYYFTTYDKGSAALEAARRAAGAAGLDAALRCYVAANAWRIATPGRPGVRAAQPARRASRCCARPARCADPAVDARPGGRVQPSATSLAIRPTPSTRSSSPSA